jgi:hypothetical protein
MSRVIKQGLDEFGAELTLKPAELEAVMARLCACGTRRIRSGRPRRKAVRCARRLREDWCRLGDRASTLPYVDSRFG